MDHYGGIKSILEHKQAADDIKIVAPEGFLQHALAETVMTGNVMSRRALYMGGTDKILANAQIDYDNGEYRWVAQVVNHVLYADPNNQQARQLQANALEQLGYQAESAPWRNFYLTAARTLRRPPRTKRQSKGSSVTPAIISAMPTHMLFDYMAVRLNGFKAKQIEQPMTLIWSFTDSEEKHLMALDHCVLSQKKWSPSNANKEAHATITLPRQTLNDLMLGHTTLEDAIDSGDMQITGNSLKVEQLFSLIDSFNLWFNLITPV